MAVRAARVVAAVAVAISTASVPHASAATPRCTLLVVAPDFATDATAFCAALAHRSDGAPTVIVARTANAGRSWSQVPATGLVTQPGDARVELYVSTEYRSDHAVYVALNASGTFRSTDGGASFALVDPAGGHLVAASAAVAVGPLTVTTHGVLLGAVQGVAEGANRSFAVDPPLPRRPVSGTPLLDVAFAAAPDSPTTTVGFGGTGAGLAYHVQMFGCTTAFSCSTPLGTFPNRMNLDRVWLSPRFTADGVIIARLVDLTTFRRRLFRSVDGGKTFHPLTSLQGILDAAYATGGSPESAVSGVADHGRTRLYARIGVYGSPRTGTPMEQILRSEDAGATWRRVATGSTEAHRRGSVPVDRPPGVDDEPAGYLTAVAERLFLAGTSGVFCSVDGGAHWAPACSR